MNGLISDFSVFSEAKKLRTSLNNSSVLVSEVQDKGNGTYKSSVAADKSHGQAPRAMLPSANGTHILRQMLTNTNPTKQNDWHIFEIQDEKDIKASQTFGKVGLDKTGLSAQINLANATNCSHLSVIHGFDSEDSVSEIFTGSIAAAKPSGNMSLKPVSQNQTEVFQGTSESQARAQQNMSNVSSLQVIANNPNAICKEIQKPVSIENTNMVLSMTAQGQSDTTDQPHTKNIFKLQSEAGIGDTCKPASNLKTTYHMITSTSSCRLPVDEGHINITGYQHNSSRQMLAPTRDNDVSFDDGTVLGSYYGDKKMFGNQEFGPGLGEIIGVSNQLFKPAIDANQQAHNKVPTINSNPDSQILDTTSIGQNLMPTAHSNNSDQIFGPEKAANQTLISVDMSQYDLDTYESLNEVFGDIDEILKKSDISETISLSNKVQMQTETNPETTNTITDQLEDLLSDEEMMETVKSYLENCPHEKVMEILPKKMIMELIAPLFQQLTKSEYLTPLLENLPKDQKQRVIQALLCEKNNESQSLSDPSLPSIRPS